MTSTSGMREALEAMNAAWDLLPGGRNYSPWQIGEWLNGKPMKDAVLGMKAALSAVPDPLENHVADSAANQAESVPQHNLAKALIHIALMPDENDEWDGRDKFHEARQSAKDALNWRTIPDGEAVEEITSRLPREEQRSSPQWRPDPRTVEEAAKVAEAHKGAAARKRRERGTKLGHLDEWAQAEITAEERGEDIAAAIIAAAIRSLNSQTPAEKE